VRAVERPTPSDQKCEDKLELVCSSGHRTTHSLARVLRLNDGWCGKCGADISYTPLADDEGIPAGERSTAPLVALKSV
jgi:hypothetical protein